MKHGGQTKTDAWIPLYLSEETEKARSDIFSARPSFSGNSFLINELTAES